MKKRAFVMLLCLAMAASVLLSGCSAQAADLMSGVAANAVSAGADLNGPGADAVTDFGVRLFQESLADGENTLISPLSVLCALAMTANGAEGETLAQMEAVFGLTVEELNQYLHTYMNDLPSDKKAKLDIANAIWFRDGGGFTAEQDFLQANADWYGAGLYQAPFDTETCKEINSWISKHTDGMIKGALEKIPEDTVMYLVNALAFDAKWNKVYEKGDVRDRVFTREDGAQEDVELMYSTESCYLEDGHAVGFLKPYAGGRYAFAALLPEEGLSVADYAASLTGERLRDLLNDVQRVKVYAAIPAFESTYGLDMAGILQAMGMTGVFDMDLTDLSGIGSVVDGSLYLSQVIHQTYISVDANGTKAAAVTIAATSSSSDTAEVYKSVYLNRPFVYLLIDCQTNVPLFIGTVMSVTG